MPNTPHVLDQPPMSIDEFCQWAKVNRETAEEEIAAGRLRKDGQLIRASDAVRWKLRLPENIYYPWGDDIIHYLPYGS